MKPNRDEAYKLLQDYNHTESLQKHGLTVEAVMKHFATLYSGDEEEWGLVGLIHDVDYEQFPDQHCIKGEEILRQHGYPESIIRAMKSHGYGICTDVEPISQMEKVLYTIDELTGLITATALMRPSKSVADLEVKSVMKKWKTKGFAAGVNRELVENGAGMLDMTIEEVIQECILGMRKME